MVRPQSNPASRFGLPELAWEEPPELARLQIYEDHTKGILSRNDSPDLWHTWSLNPYRGCQHACAYCYARYTHEYLGFGAGTDHDVKILVKPAAPALLTEVFEDPKWLGERVLFSGNTDCYQPLEHRYRLTRACLEVCLTYRNPISIITKAALIERDVDLLAALAREAGATVTLSVPFIDATLARLIEPGAPSPQRRLRAMRRLHEAGVPVSVNIAPVIPGINDREVPAVLQAAREAGAQHAAMMLVRLSGPVAQVFEARVREALPDRAAGVLARLRRARNGALTDHRFGKRFHGEGPEWAAVERLFAMWSTRLGYTKASREDGATPFRRPPRAGQQMGLFG